MKRRKNAMGARRQKGWSMVELGVVLVVFGYLGTAYLNALSGTEKLREEMGEASALSAAEQQIRAFALRAKRLPCPDVAGAGWEDASCAGAAPGVGPRVGRLPYNTLQMEEPVLQGGGAIRYGVWREATSDPEKTSDLGTAVIPSGDVDGGPRFLRYLGVAAGRPGGTGQPFVAGPDADGNAVNCSVVANNPAFVLSVGPPSPENCFSDEKNRGVRAVGRHELLGWIQSRLY
jgi:type II secretory pathway pseudopilin PulG